MSGSTGNAKIEIGLTGYDDATLARAQISSSVRIESARWIPLKKGFTFVLYPRLQLLSEKASVYLHPNNIVQLDTIGGSGHYRTELNGTAAEVVVEAAHKLSVKPLAEGLAHITIRDACLDDLSRADVFISDIKAIQLKSLDVIQLGESITMDIQALDSHGNAIAASQYKLVDFVVHVDNPNVLNVVPESRRDSGKLIMRGLEVGSSSITVTTTTYSGNLVSSGPFMIHVFPKFKLRPSTLILVPDAEYQMKWHGGPPLRTELGFELDPKLGSDVASINTHTGLITAHRVGNQRVSAKMTSYHPNESQKRKIGDDASTLIVKYLEGIRITSATSRLFVGNEIMLRVTGSQGEVWAEFVTFSYSLASVLLGKLGCSVQMGIPKQ